MSDEIKELIGDMKNKKQRVAIILRDFPETRDSDKLLILRYWYEFHTIFRHIIDTYIEAKGGSVDSILKLLADILVSPETIRRIRQVIQNRDKRYLPLQEETMRKRKKLEEAMRRAISSGALFEETEKIRQKIKRIEKDLKPSWADALLFTIRSATTCEVMPLKKKDSTYFYSPAWQKLLIDPNRIPTKLRTQKYFVIENSNIVFVEISLVSQNFVYLKPIGRLSMYEYQL
ncbi:MAG: hypothetical protein Q6363_007755 [Candidatus Njordarchaeota archaeon]